MIRIVTAAVLLMSCLAVAQAPASLIFEVASIKPNNSDDHSSSFNTSPGETIMRNVTLKQMVETAYDVKDYSLTRPDWMDTARFDVTAKHPPELREIKDPVERQAKYRVMLQTLLAERFKLAVHQDTKTLSAYALVIAKGGHKMKPSEAGDNSSMNTNNGHLTASGATMERLANWLAVRLDRPVVDKTETQGRFDFSLEFLPEQRAGGAPGEPARVADNSDSGPTIFTALQEQLGLRLQASKLPIPIVVVDHMEKMPTEN